MSRKLTLLALVLAVGVGAGAWLWPRGSDQPQDTGLPTDPSLQPVAFPDPDTLDCATVGKTMSKRGYLRVNGSDVCRFITAGLSLVEDGSNNLNVAITVWRDDAESRYRRALNLFTGRQDDPGVRQNKVVRWPVGDDGFAGYHEYIRSGAIRADTTAVFRSGNDLLEIAVTGYVQRGLSTEPLPEETTYGEITDILRALSGDGEPGKPRITTPELKQTPLLTGLTAPELPGPTADVCSGFGDVAGKTGTVPEEAALSKGDGALTYTCTFDHPEEPRPRPEGYEERVVWIRFVVHQPEMAFRAAEMMVRDLKTVRGDPPNTEALYELLVGDGGYVSYRTLGHGEIMAGYLVDGRTYVHIQIRGFTTVDGRSAPLPEETMLKDIAALLT